jgi:hypothetical protein
MPVIVRLDLGHLIKLAKVDLNLNDLAEFVELLTIYATRFQEDTFNRAPDWMQREWYGFDRPRAAEREARRALVAAIAEIWRARGGRTVGSYYSDLEEECEGPLLDLLEALLRGVNNLQLPSRDTLHHDLRFIATGRERNHGR